MVDCLLDFADAGVADVDKCEINSESNKVNKEKVPEKKPSS